MSELLFGLIALVCVLFGSICGINSQLMAVSAITPPLRAFEVSVGIDRLFSTSYRSLIEKKRVGLITNQTGVNKSLENTRDIFVREHERGTIRLSAFFAPEHGLMGEMYAGEGIPQTSYKGIPVFSLHGATRRPTREMLQNIDVLVYDIQDIGSRSYTFATTLFYCMEEAAKMKIRVLVLDRPNPLGGLMVDGPMLEDQFRSFVGYINVPYCHGMTIGELARYFNEEYKVGANLTVVPMLGWKRSMTFQDTGLPWIPTSPNIPEASTALCYPATGILGELGFVSIGVGYTLPFKVIAAPWINASRFTQELNKTSIQGVRFSDIWIKPYLGQFNGKKCQGALIVPSSDIFPPVTTTYWIMDVLKLLYPKQVMQAMSSKEHAQQLEMFYKICGTKKIADILLKEKRPYAALCALHAKERAQFMDTRQRYLIASYREK